MAATVSAWGKPGAWALDSEENEADLLQQQKDESVNGNHHSNGGDTAALSDFPSLSIAAATKTKKKKGQTISLQEFNTYSTPKPAQARGLTHEEIMMLPSGPRERTAEELDRSRLGGGFRSYGSKGDESSNSRWGSSRVSSDEPRRQGDFGRESNRDLGPSRADEIDDWGAAKKSAVGNGFERKERGGFFSDSQSRADESDSWVSNKSFVPFEGRKSDRRVGFESSGGADSENWVKRKEEEGRRFGGGTGGAFDSLRERRNGHELPDSDNWGKKREEETGNGRPRLNLKPRTLPVADGLQNGSASVPVADELQNGSAAVVKLPVADGLQNGSAAVVKSKASNPFGEARPREDVLKEKGKDWKEIDEKLESMKIKEVAGLTEGTSVGKRSFGNGNRRASFAEEGTERRWRKPDTVDVRPQSAEKVENGHFEEAEDKDQHM